jgi:YD repeat-containing protein
LGSPAVVTQSSFEYDANGLIIKEAAFTNTSSPIIKKYDYIPGLGLLNQYTISAGSSPPKLTVLTYDTKYRFNVSKIRYTYPLSLLNMYIKNDIYEPLFGNIIESTSENCQKTAMSYDAFGQETEAKFKVGTPEAYTVTTNKNWDNSLSNALYKETITHPGKPDATIIYDILGQKIKTISKGFNGQDVFINTSYKPTGMIATETNAYMAGETPITTSYHYDEVNRLIQTINTGAGTSIFEYDYANSNEKMKTTNLNTAQTKSVTKDPTGKIISSTDQGGVLNFAYDSWGNQIEAKKGVSSILTTNVYNNKNQLITKTDNNAGSSSYTYDDLGQLLKEVDPNGVIHTYQYDDFGRKTAKNGPEGVITYQYGDGLNYCKNDYLSTVTNFNGITENFQYDGYGRLIESKKVLDGITYSNKYEYDKYDNLIMINYPDNIKIYNEYTADGYLSKVGIPTAYNGSGQPTAFNYLFAAQGYNGMDQIKQYQYGNGVQTTKT